MEWKFIYRGLRARWRDQRRELTALLSGLRPADVAVDVGANKGSYVWSLSRAVPHGRVIAFEPQPSVAGYLKSVCLRAGLHNVHVEDAGCSRESGRRLLAIPGEGDSSPGASFEPSIATREACRVVEVATFSLDDYFRNEAGHIGAVKIDVEGHELAVFEGGAQMIAEYRPIIVCEIEQRHVATGTVRDVLDFVRSLGYDGSFVHPDGLQNVTRFRPELHQRSQGDRYWDAPDYCNNFIFTPRQ
jgi:FkbM family methyltransferase